MPTADKKSLQESLIQSIALENISGTLMLLQNTLEREESNSEISHITELDSYSDYVKNAILNLKEISTYDADTLKKIRSEVGTNIKSLSKLYQTIDTHTSKINHLSTLVRCELLVRALKSEHFSSEIAFSNEDANQLLKEYTDFFQKIKGQDNAQEILCEVVKNIPWDLSDDEFYAQIANLLRPILQTADRHFCEYTLSRIHGYIALDNPLPSHAECTEAVDFIISTLAFDPKKLSDRELEVLYDQTLPKMVNIFFQIATQIEVLYEDMYYLAILYAFSFTFDDLLPEIAQKDMYFSTCEFLEKEWNPLDRELHLSAVLTKIEELIDPLITTLMDTLNESEDAIESLGGIDQLDEETKRIVLNASVTHAYYLSHVKQPYISIDEVDDTPFTDEEAQAQIDSLINNGKGLFSNLALPIKKLLMQLFRTTIPIVYDEESVLKEILDFFTSTTISDENKFLLCENLYPILQDFDLDVIINSGAGPDFDGYFDEEEDFSTLDNDD